MNVEEFGKSYHITDNEGLADFVIMKSMSKLKSANLELKRVVRTNEAYEKQVILKEMTDRMLNVACLNILCTAKILGLSEDEICKTLSSRLECGEKLFDM